MDLFEAIEKRCSVRKYESRDVEDAKLRRVLAAGIAAPTARNRQDFKFVVVKDNAVRAKLVEATEQEWITAVPVIIAVVGLSPERVMFCDVPSDPVDCAIAIDHMSLAAVAQGLGTCWIGHFKQDECKKILGISADAKIVEMLTIGYPAQPSAATKKRKSFDELVSYDKF
ncbi:MAG: nitroreductase family protein [Phycisphaerae bacterium]|nr:nitroreductase family protein [Phycisphaerae bacterium]